MGERRGRGELQQKKTQSGTHPANEREKERRTKKTKNNDNYNTEDIPEQVGPKLEIGDKKDDAVKVCFAAVAAAMVECDYEEFWIEHLLHTSGSITMFRPSLCWCLSSKLPWPFFNDTQVILSTGVSPWVAFKSMLLKPLPCSNAFFWIEF
jgi:hypothetical protein